MRGPSQEAVEDGDAQASNGSNGEDGAVRGAKPALSNSAGVCSDSSVKKVSGNVGGILTVVTCRSISSDRKAVYRSFNEVAPGVIDSVRRTFRACDVCHCGDHALRTTRACSRSEKTFSLDDDFIGY